MGYTGHKYSQELIDEVTNFVIKNGKKKAVEKFPDVNVQSICTSKRITNKEKFKVYFWSDEDILDLIKFEGILSTKNKLKYFQSKGKRTTSHTALRLIMVNRLAKAPKGIHGLNMGLAEKILMKGYPVIVTQVRGAKNNYKKLVLWCDAILYLKSDVPEVVKDIVIACAKFQNRLFDGNPREEINKMLKEMNYE